MMRIPERASGLSITARSWLKAIMTILLASVMLAAGFWPWVTRYVIQMPESMLYNYQSDIQVLVAAFAGICFATLIYFGATVRRFVATTIIALILMSATAIAALLVGAAEEKLGLATFLGLMSLPPLAAVATKAANIASQKKGDIGISKKFGDSFSEALSNENMAELFLWTIAWGSGGLGVFLLSKAIDMW